MTMETGVIFQAVIGTVVSLGGLSLIKFLFFMKPERRIRNIEADEKEMNVMKMLVESLKSRIEQQDEKIRQLNGRVDLLYAEKHELEKENNELVRENAMLRIQLAEAERNVCVRPDDECMRRQPPRDHCRLKRLANGYYDRFYTGEQLAEGERQCDEEDERMLNNKKGRTNGKYKDTGVSEKPDEGGHA